VQPAGIFFFALLKPNDPIIRAPKLHPSRLPAAPGQRACWPRAATCDPARPQLQPIGPPGVRASRAIFAQSDSCKHLRHLAEFCRTRCCWTAGTLSSEGNACCDMLPMAQGIYSLHLEDDSR